MVIHKYILLSSFFEDIYKKLGVTKNINVLNSVIIDYFVHYQMFLANNYFLYKHSLTSRQKVTQIIQHPESMESVFNSKLSDSAFTPFFRKLLRYSTIIKKECN